MAKQDPAAFSPSQIPEDVRLQHDGCPLKCPPDDRQLIVGSDRLLDLPGVYQVVQCKTCGVIRTDPRPTPDTIGFYYPSDYAPYNLPKPEPAPPRLDSLSASRQRKIRRRQAMGLRAPKELPIAPPGDLLDIGCANGAYMQSAQAAGWAVDGMEFSEDAAAIARSQGLNVVVGPLESTQPPKQQYDIVTAWMVLEHMHDPVTILERIKTWLKPDGWLAFSVPDFDAIDRKLFGARWYALQVPGHMTHFNKHGLQQVLAAAGWSMELIYWQQNPNNLFQSIRYWALDRKLHRLARLMEDIIQGRRFAKLHKRLAKWLALFRQSGRVTVWARPNPR